MNSAPDPTWHRQAEVAGLSAWVPGAAWFFVIALVLGCLLSLLMPPLKALDEADQIRRAGFLMQGQVRLHVQGCDDEGAACRAGRSMAGGMLDAGLRDYLWQNRPALRQHESVLGRQQADALPWRGLDVFDAAPAAARVFPAVHVPLAAGLWLGQQAGLSVDDSYRLARFLSLASGLLVLALAFRVYRPPAVVPGLLLLPAVLFQAASGSVDFLVTALALLVLACFLRVVALRERAPSMLGGLMALAVTLVGTAAVGLLPMLLLMGCAAWLAGRRAWWGLTVLAALAVVAWQVLVGLDGVDFRADRVGGTGEMALRYLQDPLQLVQVLGATLTDREWLKSLLMSFIGQSGALEFSLMVYPALATGLGVIWLCSLAPLAQWREQWLARVVLLLCALLCALAVVLRVLVVALPFAPLLIEGVEGQQLLVPVALGLVAFAGWRPGGSVLVGLRQGLLFAFAAACILLSVQRLLTGYYLPQFPAASGAGVIWHGAAVAVPQPGVAQ